MSNDAGGIRTLEDTVADLLRPLLREWLENNMPRIVENALRIEVAESVKKQLDTSTRKPNGLS
jgi:cell pole-organizing protein PopZ